MLIEINLSPGSLDRLRRIQILKGYDQKRAIDFAISLAWYATETNQDIPIAERPMTDKEIQELS